MKHESINNNNSSKLLFLLENFMHAYNVVHQILPIPSHLSPRLSPNHFPSERLASCALFLNSLRSLSDDWVACQG